MGCEGNMVKYVWGYGVQHRMGVVNFKKDEIHYTHPFVAVCRNSCGGRHFEGNVRGLKGGKS